MYKLQRHQRYIRRLFSAWQLFAACATVLLLQACASSGSNAPENYDFGQAGEHENEFLNNHGSVEFIRVDKTSGKIGFFDADGPEKILELGPGESKVAWMKGGSYTILISDNVKNADLGNVYEVDLDIINTHSYQIRVAMDKDLSGGKSDGSIGLDNALGLAKGIGLSLALVLFSVATGGAGTVVIPPIDFSEEDAPTEFDSVEIFETNI